MNLTRSQRIRLGVFVVAGVALLLAAVAAVLGPAWIAEVDHYSVRFNESVSGLEVSSQVKYQGLRIGRVESLSVAKDDPSIIVVQIGIKPGTTLYNGTKARLDSSALTGLTTINLTPGDLRSGSIPPGSVLPAGLSFTDRLTGEAQVLRQKVETILNQVSEWTNDANLQRVQRVLTSAEKLLNDLDQAITTLQPTASKTLKDVSAVSQAATDLGKAGGKTLAEVNRSVRTLQGQTQEVLRSANLAVKSFDGSQLAPTLAGAQTTLRKINTFVDSVDLSAAMKGADGAIRALAQVAQRLRTLIVAVQAAMRGGQEDAVKAMRNVRAASQDLKAFLREIARDPSLLLRGQGARR